MSNRTVQMRALVNGHITEGPISAKPRDPRNIFWTTPALAQHYIDNKVATPVVTSTLSEAPSIGPTETKPAEPTAKKKKKKKSLHQTTSLATRPIQQSRICLGRAHSSLLRQRMQLQRTASPDYCSVEGARLPAHSVAAGLSL